MKAYSVLPKAKQRVTKRRLDGAKILCDIIESMTDWDRATDGLDTTAEECGLAWLQSDWFQCLLRMAPQAILKVGRLAVVIALVARYIKVSRIGFVSCLVPT